MKIKAATAIIDCQAWRDNLQQIKKFAPNSKIMAIMKARAYGHGITQAAVVLQNGIDYIGVARLSEALELRAAAIVKPILLLEGFFSSADLLILGINNIETVIHCQEQLDALLNAEGILPIKVWLKIDTGMHRLGIPVDKVEDYYQQLSASKNVSGPVNLISHFSRADEVDNDYTQKQLDEFLMATEGKQVQLSIAASGGILYWPNSHFDVVRPGIILHGISPSKSVASDYNLTPAMKLTSSLIAINKHKQGSTIGYGGAWTCQQDTNIGVVAIGYGDGYPRDAAEGTPVYINNRIVPIVGKVSMDMLTVDLGADSQDKIGDEVILWGKELPVEIVAKAMGLISYELVTKLTDRVVMQYQNM